MMISKFDFFFIIALVAFLLYALGYVLGTRRCRHDWIEADAVASVSLIAYNGEIRRVANKFYGYKCIKCGKSKVEHRCG